MIPTRAMNPTATKITKTNKQKAREEISRAFLREWGEERARSARGRAKRGEARAGERSEGKRARSAAAGIAGHDGAASAEVGEESGREKAAKCADSTFS